jgi:hypothetical protein
VTFRIRLPLQNFIRKIELTFDCRLSRDAWSAGSGPDFHSQSKVMNQRLIGEDRRNKYCCIRKCICDESEVKIFWVLKEEQNQDNELSIHNQ